jgi:putative pyruvate formate lyase activating enzyme
MSMASMEPVYIKTFERGYLRNKAALAREKMTSCTLCPRLCRVDRLSGETGICKTSRQAWVSSYGPHFGEEQPLVGAQGSGTLFFTHCNLMCAFCQNYDISHQSAGRKVEPEALAGMMLELQSRGCHNLNFVTPSHVIPHILEGLEIGVEKGLKIPLVYNSSAYDRVESLRILEGVFDIYMPDFKFWDSDLARESCDAADYPEVARKAVLEMHRQVGDLVVDESGLAVRGLLIRHLVLPDGLAGTREIMRFIATRISKESYVNIMPQYRPCGDAARVKGLNRYPSETDFEKAVQAAEAEGITRLDKPRRVFMIS